MRDIKIEKWAKVIFIICLVFYLLQEKSLYALVYLKELVIGNIIIFVNESFKSKSILTIRDLIINNALISTVIVAIFLLMAAKMKGGKK
jgi:hypothetical protein